jgi:hypothetical protein
LKIFLPALLRLEHKGLKRKLETGKLGLVLEKRKKISQTINDDLCFLFSYVFIFGPLPPTML